MIPSFACTSAHYCVPFVPYLQAKAALASGMCVVIGLQSTGEAAADAMGLEPGPLPGFVSPCKEMLLRFIQQNFPEHAAQTPEGMEIL
jgi:hypothetical protein